MTQSIDYLNNINIFKVQRARGRRYEIDNLNDLLYSRFKKCGESTQRQRTFSCLNFLSSLISLKMRLASTASSNALGTFLMATLTPVSLLRAELSEEHTGVTST